MDHDQPWNLGDIDATFRNHNALVLERACKEQFEKFWEEWMDDVGRQKYGEVVSPYAV